MPAPASRVEKKGSVACSRTSGGMPGPSSSTVRTSSPLRLVAESRTAPLGRCEERVVNETAEGLFDGEARNTQARRGVRQR